MIFAHGCYQKQASGQYPRVLHRSRQSLKDLPVSGNPWGKHWYKLQQTKLIGYHKLCACPGADFLRQLRGMDPFSLPCYDVIWLHTEPYVIVCSCHHCLVNMATIEEIPEDNTYHIDKNLLTESFIFCTYFLSGILYITISFVWILRSVACTLRMALVGLRSGCLFVFYAQCDDEYLDMPLCPFWAHCRFLSCPYYVCQVTCVLTRGYHR